MNQPKNQGLSWVTGLAGRTRAVLWLRLERLLDPCWNSRGQISQDDADEQTEQGVQDIVESVEVLALEHAKSEGEEDGKAPKGGRRQSERSPVHQQDQHSSTQEDRNRDPHNAELSPGLPGLEAVQRHVAQQHTDQCWDASFDHRLGITADYKRKPSQRN